MTVFRCFLFLLTLTLYACSTSTNAPVEDIGQAGKHAQAKTYIVVAGDTLFSIALRFDLDYKKLAAANNIYAPYIIRPNDVIYLKETFSASEPHGIAVYPARNPVVGETVKNTGVISSKGVKNNQSSTLQVVKKQEPVVPEKKQAGAEQPKSGSLVAVERSWLWPVSGEVVRQFSPQDTFSKGIDISAKIGTPVVSSRSGEVVYAGSGLKGYGNLIIIRHDDTYISAYAHNKTILVKEGQAVKQGEVVAESGMSGAQFAKLHFEIREHGKPINPLQLLPAK